MNPLTFYLVGDGVHKGELSTIQALIGPALVVGLFSYILTMSMIKSISIRYGYRVGMFPALAP